VRDTDTVARLGPQTFAIIQPLVDKPSDAAVLAERIVADMALPFEDARGEPLSIAASVGIAVYPGAGGTAADMIRHAGRALLRARLDGGGTWRYAEPDMDVSLRDSRSQEEDLRVALRDGQFSIAWQPIFETATMRTAGFEASPRWDHPERGPVPPAEFIPAAEACGLFMPLTRSILMTACAEAAGWPRPETLSISLLPQHFARPGIVEIAQEALRDTGLPADRLELGIAESALIQDSQCVPDILRGLKALGIRIAMDDFAAGRISLTYLRRFCFDKIKIGRDTIGGMHGVEAEAIVRAIIAIARSLQVEVAAEGVETAEQLAVLKTLGCGFVQGAFPRIDRAEEPPALHIPAAAK
jgi:predicted signal transduction protein with EAL and GGDEF domain